MTSEAMHSPGADPKVAIVSGATKGIGAGIAQQLAAAGIAVVITGRREEDARQAAAALRAQGGEALGVAFNLERREDLASLVETAVAEFGRLDLLVNNALSTSCLAPPDAATDAAVEFAVTSNITHTYLLTRLAYPHLKAVGGQVINIASAVVSRHLLGLPLYAIVKGAVVQMTKVLAAEWAGDGIRVNAINPGFIRTSAFSDLGMPDELVARSYDYYRAYQPLGGIGQPDDVGRLVACLAGAAGRLMTGAVIDVDGGFTVQGRPLYAG